MRKIATTLYVREIEGQCDFGLFAADRLSQSIPSAVRDQEALYAALKLMSAYTDTNVDGCPVDGPIPAEEEFAEEEFAVLSRAAAASGTCVFFYIHALLSHASNVAKILWEGGRTEQRVRERTQHLREGLGITRPFLIQNSRFRNDLEHIDDRLDRWDADKHLMTLDIGFFPLPVYDLDSDGRPIKVNEVLDMDLLFPESPKRTHFRAFNHKTMTYTFNKVALDLKQVISDLQEIRRLSQAWRERRFD